MPDQTPARKIGPSRYAIDSFSGEGKSYIVDLSVSACSCPQFQFRSVNLPIGDQSRKCKHILAVEADLRQLAELKARLEPDTAPPAPTWQHAPYGGWQKVFGPRTDQEAFRS